MNQESLTAIIQDQTARALWEVKNIVDSIPDELWNKKYGEMPLWKHVYHMLHSLDLWYINPRDPGFVEPSIHEENLNSLDVVSNKQLSRDEINMYYEKINTKLKDYIMNLTDGELLKYPIDCEYNKFTLILAQFRHLHSHMGMIMGFIVEDTELWPRLIGLENPIPQGNYSKYF